MDYFVKKFKKNNINFLTKWRTIHSFSSFIQFTHDNILSVGWICIANEMKEDHGIIFQGLLRNLVPGIDFIVFEQVGKNLEYELAQIGSLLSWIANEHEPDFPGVQIMTHFCNK